MGGRGGGLSPDTPTPNTLQSKRCNAHDVKCRDRKSSGGVVVVVGGFRDPVISVGAQIKQGVLVHAQVNQVIHAHKPGQRIKRAAVSSAAWPRNT